MTKRDIGQEVLDSIRAIKRREGRQYTIDISCDPKTIRKQMNLGPSAFASLLGVTLKTLQYWEQGKQQPSGSAKLLLRVAAKHPDVLFEVLEETSDTMVSG